MNRKQALVERINKLPEEKKAQLFAQLARTNENRGVPRRVNLDKYPVSYGQLGLWNIFETEGPSSIYNMPSAYLLEDLDDVDALKKSILEVVNRHASLRTSFEVMDGEIYQKIHPADVVELGYVDLSKLDEDEKKEKLFEQVDKNSLHVFDLTRPPLFIASLVKLDENVFALCMNAHHIIFDGWSKGILLREISHYYRVYSNKLDPDTGKWENSLPEPELRYVDFSNWERSQDAIEKQVNYWVEKLRDASHLLNIGDRARPRQSSGAGRSIPIKIDSDLASDLLGLGKTCGASAYMTMLTTYAIMLSRYARQSRVLVGTPVNNRQQDAFRHIIGYFLNTSVMDLSVDESKTFVDLLESVKRSCLDTYANQNAPFNRIVEGINPPRVKGISPLFQAMFVFQVPGASDFSLLKTKISQIASDKINARQIEKLAEADEEVAEGELDSYDGQSKYDLYLTFIENSEDSSLGGWLTYNSDLFSPGFIKQFLVNYIKLIKEVVRKPRVLLADITFNEANHARTSELPAAYQTVKLESISRIFEKQTAASPDALALSSGAESYTFAELNVMANRVARYLASAGVAQGKTVGLGFPRGVDMIAGMLAVFKLGAAYVPLEPSLPAQRLKLYVDIAKPDVVLISDDFPLLPDGGGYYIRLNSIREELNLLSGDDLSRKINIKNLAYILFTSGSTGQPKGVMATQEGVLNRLQWMWDTYPFNNGEVVCHKTTCGFVDSIAEIWGTLLAGIPLVIASQETVLDLFEFVELLRKSRVSRLTLVPSLLLSLLDHYPELGEIIPDLKLVVSSGEALDNDLVRRFVEALPQATLLNLYGSTEVAADATVYQVAGQRSQENIPIGRAIQNCEVHILDPYANPCPRGVTGEIHVSGIPVSLGYLNNPSLTAERFVPDHINGNGGRMFKTNDLGRLDQSGNILYLGRNDNQVKIRGFRMSLDEIKHVIRSHPAVKDGAVITNKSPAGDVQLVGFFVAEEECDQVPDQQALKEHLKAALPDYMIPRTIHLIDDIPTLSNGKLDLTRLPDPNTLSVEESRFEEARTETEKKLTQIWSEVLKVREISRTSNFFDLGGHSISVTNVVSRIRSEFNLLLPVEDVYSLLVLRELAEHIDMLLALEKLACTQSGKADDAGHAFEVMEI